MKHRTRLMACTAPLLTICALTPSSWATNHPGILLEQPVSTVLEAVEPEAVEAEIDAVVKSGISQIVVQPSAASALEYSFPYVRGQVKVAGVIFSGATDQESAAIEAAEFLKTGLWMSIPADADPAKTLKRVSKKTKTVVIPHSSSAVTTVEQAYDLIKESTNPQLRIGIDWNASVSSGNADRLAGLVPSLIERLEVVILPVDPATRPLIKALKRSGFEGTVVVVNPTLETMEKWKELNTGLPNAFGVFDMGSFGKLSPADQAALAVDLGYELTIATGWQKPKVDYMVEYLETPLVASGRIGMPAVIWTPGVNQKYPPKEKMEQLFTALKTHNAKLWMKGRGKKEEYKDAPAFYQRVADEAAEYGVEIVLYPHHNTTYLDAEEALELMRKVDRPNVRISMHMCHELKASNDERIPEIVKEVAPYLEFVSISGADSSMNRKNGNWGKTIMPLDEGDISNVPFVRALYENGYIGPIYVHTYGVDVPAKDHLKRSIDTWREIELEAVRGN